MPIVEDSTAIHLIVHGDNWVVMKKYAFLFAVNVLIFGSLSGSAWMTIATADAASPVTWVMATLPLVILAIIALWLTPRALAALKSGSEQRAEAKQERAEAHVAQTVMDDSAASRLRRVVRTAEEVDFEAGPAEEIEDECEPEAEAEPESFIAPEVEPSYDAEPATDIEPSTESVSQGQWNWLKVDGAQHQLRLAADTGFPWVAATIAEMASAVIDSYPVGAGGDFLPEAEAWLAIASDLLPSQPLLGDDAQSFVGWINDLAAHSHLNQDGVTLDALLDKALGALGERADDDDALAASLPDVVYGGHQHINAWAKAG